jgi:hypothetical protein
MLHFTYEKQRMLTVPTLPILIFTALSLKLTVSMSAALKPGGSYSSGVTANLKRKQLIS